MNTDRSNSIPVPPRLLEGVALLFWGGVTGHPVIGLVCALLVEAHAWTDLRWNFGERGFFRAWLLAFLLGSFTLVWFWLESASVLLLFDVLVWMPVHLLPVILAQNYAIRPSMPLNTFSFIARRKMLLDRAAGRVVDPIQVHVGYPYVCLVIVAAALSRINQLAFFVGLVFLAATILFFASPVSRKRPFGVAVALTLVALVGGFSSLGLVAFWSSLDGVFTLPSRGFTSGDRSQTAIGQIGLIKQSKRIYWRVRDEDGAGPRLFREAVYNHYSPGQWWHKPVADRRTEDEADTPVEVLKREEDYEDMWSRELADERKQFAFDPAEFDRHPSIRSKLSVTGRVRTRTPLPLLESTQRIYGLIIPDGTVTANSLGTVRLENPEHGVVSFDVYCGGQPLHESLPDPDLDRQLPQMKAGDEDAIPSDDLLRIREVCDEWGLRGLSAREAIKIIKNRFVREFEYSPYLRFGHATGNKSAIAQFLAESNRAGHCEYFATTAVLLLREAGIPARYCVGYSAQEQNNAGDWILRGSHAHAWCRVWHGEMPPDIIPDGVDPRSYGTWEDFDPTPPGWFAIEGSGLAWNRKFLDWWQSAREDFLLWRTAPGNTELINRVMFAIAFLLIAYLAVRLWQSRTRRTSRSGHVRGSEEIITPLHALAKPARRWLGPRPEGQSFSEWILQLGENVPAVRQGLRRAVSFHWKARFDPIGLDPYEEGEFVDLCSELRVRLRKERGGRI